MNLKPVDIPERYELFPQAAKLADLVLKKLGFMTSTEQIHKAKSEEFTTISLIAQKYAYPTSKNNESNARFHAEQWMLYRDVDSFRDLKHLQLEGVAVHEALKKVKQNYNILIKSCLERNPKYLDLVWQVYRRTHKLHLNPQELERLGGFHEAFISDLEEIIAKIEREKGDSDNGIKISHFPKTDEERIKHYESELHFSYSDDFLKSEPSRRLVEFDPHYFYGTGRFAFALPNGDIYQTIWDERKKEFPLFDISDSVTFNL